MAANDMRVIVAWLDALADGAMITKLEQASSFDQQIISTSDLN
jgi:hypothetical protein